jgi:hypothetical protein
MLYRGDVFRLRPIELNLPVLCAPIRLPERSSGILQRSPEGCDPLTLRLDLPV